MHVQEQVAEDVVRRATKRNAARVTLDDVELRFLAREFGECQVGSPNRPLPRDWAWRVCEALQVITARWHEWTIVEEWKEERQSVCVRFPCAPERSLLQRPIHRGSPTIEQASWKVFEAFLRIRWQDDKSAHNIGTALRSVIRASSAHIEALAVQLGVAIERLLRHEFPETAAKVRIDDSQLEEAASALATAAIDDGVRKRLLGALSAFRNPRPQELLSVLADEGKIRRKFVRIYGKLRNPAAHGKTADEDLQEWFDLTGAGVAMLYELIFARINYRGPYTDHSERSYPTLTYPPSA